MIFTTGNLLTLGIVIAVLILYRQLDKSNRSLDKVRKYGERLKEDLAAFVSDREAAVKDYAVELDVQQKVAKELLKRLVLTEEELAAKAAAVAKIDERISAYDASLEELVRMTARVQENLGRLKDEASFTDSALKRVTEAKAQLEKAEKGLSDLEFRFERENAAALERAEEAAIAAVRSTVADLQATAETIERRVEDHREAVVAAERRREELLKRDFANFEVSLRGALEDAAAKADKLEDATFQKLKDQAIDRSQRFQTAVEEKLAQFHEASKARAVEVQGLVKGVKDDWKQESSEIEERQRSFRDEWKKELQELVSLAKAQREEWKREHSEGSAEGREVLSALRADVETLRTETAAQMEALERASSEASESVGARLGELRDTTAETVASLDSRLRDALEATERKLASVAEESERKTLDAVEASLAEYRKAQDGRFRRLEALANDADRLEAELRRALGDTEERVRRDFALFEKAAADSRAEAASEFAVAAQNLKNDMDALEQELAALKSRAYDNVSEKLKLFEDDFFQDLSKRSEDIDRRLVAWKEGLDTDLGLLAAKAAEEREQAENAYSEELRARLTEQSDRSAADLERLKEQTGAFEEGIREQMAQADQSLQSFKEQLGRDLEEARSAAAAATKAEIGRNALAMAELLKRDQRELEEKLTALSEDLDGRTADIAERLDSTRRDMDQWQLKFAQQLREADSAVDEARRRARDLAAESDERLAAVRTAIEEGRGDAEAHREALFAKADEQFRQLDGAVKDADRRVKDFVAQTKLFDRAEELKKELERRIEDLSGDIDRLDQRRSEAAELEVQFVKIKRLEDEVNAKMTRFLSEKRRIELMEADFKRLIQTAQAVDEKLVQVTGTDDVLQGIQAQLKRLEDAAADAEEKYQRIEKKNQILDATNDGIDRNFQALREADGAAKKLDQDLKRMDSELAQLRPTIEKLAAENEKAKAVAERIGALDGALADIEARAESLQTAREWLARTETRLSEISKQAQDQVKIMGTLLKEDGRKGTSKDRGAPPIGTRETVVKLAHQGWSVDEIARAVKLSKGEVELILEISPKD